MAIPAYAKARIAYLNFRYAIEPQIETRQSYREGAKQFTYEDSLAGKRLRNEIHRIIDSYNAVPKTPPSVIAAAIKKSQKAAIARAIKQEEQGRIDIANWLADKKEKKGRD